MSSVCASSPGITTRQLPASAVPMSSQTQMFRKFLPLHPSPVNALAWDLVKASAHTAWATLPGCSRREALPRPETPLMQGQTKATEGGLLQSGLQRCRPQKHHHTPDGHLPITHTHTHTGTWVYTHTYAHTHRHMGTHTYTHRHTGIHTCTHIHMHTHAQAEFLSHTGR